jgi:hypothetical protein
MIDRELELEYRKYGRSCDEVKEELRSINDCLFGFVGRTGDIMEAYQEIVEDFGMLVYLDDIAKERAAKKGEYFFPEGEFFMKERVKNLLYSQKTLSGMYD